jgi:hypothetical protein
MVLFFQPLPCCRLQGHKFQNSFFIIPDGEIHPGITVIANTVKKNHGVILDHGAKIGQVSESVSQ